MEGTKTKYILVALVVIVLVTASIGFYLIKDAGGITAKEGKIIADQAAQELIPNSNLIVVSASGNVNTDGKSHGWEYYYKYQHNNLIQGVIMYVEINERVKHSSVFEINTTLETSFIPAGFEYNEIINWTMDSSEAMDLALQNDLIHTYNSKYSNARNGMGLGMINSTHSLNSATFSLNSTVLAWNIGWEYVTASDDYYRAIIVIDATTGEVLYVEADN